jgi:hypothetical protein
MRWESIATWFGPSPNTGDRMIEHRGVVLHIAQGTYDGTIAWQRNRDSDVSSHFIVAPGGGIAQMVDTDVTAWTQAEGNGRWLSIEFAGYTGKPLTDAQVQAAAMILAAAHRHYGVPLQLANTPRGRGVGYHAMGGTAWGNHPRCPGEPIIAQRMEIIRRAKKLIAPLPPPRPAPSRPRPGPPPGYHPPVTVARTPAWRSTISGIAAHFDVQDWRDVWGDPRNAGLRRRRGQPDQIQPGDRVYVRKRGTK